VLALFLPTVVGRIARVPQFGRKPMPTTIDVLQELLPHVQKDQATIRSLQAESSQKDERIRELEDALAQTTAERDSGQEMVLTLRKLCRKKDEQNRQAQAEKAILQQQLQQANAERDRETRKHRKEAARRYRAEARQLEIRDECDALVEQAEADAQRRIEEAETQARERAEQAERRAREAEEVAQVATASTGKMRKKVGRLQKRLNQAQVRNERLQSELDGERAVVEDLKAKFEG
jgi:chromosome segregation ATPase